MAELPPHSQISLRIDGNAMTITIPSAAGPSRGLLGGRQSLRGGNWAAAAAFAFLAVTFIAQGILSGKPAWTGAGLVCFLVTAWQMVALRGLPAGHVKLQISPDQLTRITGPENRRNANIGRDRPSRTSASMASLIPQP